MAMAVGKHLASLVAAPVSLSSSTALQLQSSSKCLRPPAAPSRVSRRHNIVVAAAEDEKKSRGIFSFVTDNESSKSAIQLPNTPAQDGNLGQMISVGSLSHPMHWASKF